LGGWVPNRVNFSKWSPDPHPQKTGCIRKTTGVRKTLKFQKC